MVIYDRDRTRSIKKATTPSAVGGQTQNDPRHCRVHLSTPDSEQAGDEWDLAVSESLRLSRADLGDDPAAVGRRDILAFTNRLAYK